MSEGESSSAGSSKGKAPMPPQPAPPSVSNLPPPPSIEEGMHSRASDAGSVKGDSASDAGSTATMDTSMSAGTLASGASTAFFSQQVHFFSLDDFAGHEIQTILEDGENEQPNDGDDRADGASAENQSVRPGSVVSNIEQRLDEIEIFRGEAESQSQPVAELSELLASCTTGAASSSSAGVGPGNAATIEAQYLSLLQQMQHRELTPADLQLLMRLEQQHHRTLCFQAVSVQVRPVRAGLAGAPRAHGAARPFCREARRWGAAAAALLRMGIHQAMMERPNPTREGSMTMTHDVFYYVPWLSRMKRCGAGGVAARPRQASCATSVRCASNSTRHLPQVPLADARSGRRDHGPVANLKINHERTLVMHRITLMNPTTHLSPHSHMHSHSAPTTQTPRDARPHTAAPARTPAPDESRTICNAGGVYALRRSLEVRFLAPSSYPRISQVSKRTGIPLAPPTSDRSALYRPSPSETTGDNRR